MGHHEVLALEVDPIRELITVLLPDDVKVSVNPGELFTTNFEGSKGKIFRTGPYFIMHAFLIINICGPLFFETMHIPKSTEYIHQ